MPDSSGYLGGIVNELSTERPESMNFTSDLLSLSRYGKTPGVSRSVFTNLKDIIPLQATNAHANVTDVLELKTDRGNAIEGSIEANPLRCTCNIGTTCCSLGHCLNKDVNLHEGMPSNLDAFTDSKQHRCPSCKSLHENDPTKI